MVALEPLWRDRVELDARKNTTPWRARDETFASRIGLAGLRLSSRLEIAELWRVRETEEDLRALDASWRPVCILSLNSIVGRMPLTAAKLPESCRLSFMTLQTAANRMAGSRAGVRTSAYKSRRDFAYECRCGFSRRHGLLLFTVTR